MNWNQALFPSLQRRGGCGINKKARSLRSAADGVVSSAKLFRPKDFADLLLRLRELRLLRDICRGRNGDRSPRPARIRTYRFPIFGSCRRSAAKACRRIRMTNDSGRNPAVDVTPHAVPRQVAFLAPATQPFLP